MNDLLNLFEDFKDMFQPMSDEEHFDKSWGNNSSSRRNSE